MMAITFVIVLVASFFALAPAALACHSELLFEKTELGAAAPGETYTILIREEQGRFDGEVDVTAGSVSDPVIVPPGTYHFEEVGAPVGVSFSENPVTVTDEDNGETITIIVTNPYYAGKLAIQKIESGDTAPEGIYTFDIVGPDGVEPFSVEVAAGDTWTSDWLPLGSYDITERDAPAGHTLAPNPAILTEDGVTVTVTATNPYRDYHGKLAIQKIESGDTAPEGIYTFDIVGPDGVEPFSVEVAAGDTWTSDWLPLGSYDITERDAPAGHTLAPNPAILTEDGVTVTVTATNPYRDHHGKLAIQKIESGDTAPEGIYTFEVRDAANTVVATLDVAAGSTGTTGWLPLGTYTVVELDAPDGATLAPNPVTIDEDGETVTVTATNPYRDYHGKLAIQKIESGTPLNVGTYTINVSGPKSFSVTLKGGDTWTSDWLPLGTYTVTEVDAPTGATIVPNPAVLQVDGATVTVVVTNPTLLGSSGTLPSTGGGLGILPWTAAALVAIGGTLLIVVRGSRRHA